VGVFAPISRWGASEIIVADFFNSDSFCRTHTLSLSQNTKPMSKREHFLRYGAIINKLRGCREATFEEIKDYLQRQGEISGNTLTTSLRTFQRDLDDIRSAFNIDIQYSFSRKVYYVAEDNEQNDVNNRMLEAFEMFNTLNVAGNLTQFVQFEKRKPHGMEHFYRLLDAIKNRFVIRFAHQKHWENEHTNRVAEPYSLKEFKGRWYLFAKDQKDNKTKTFGLDRISELEITKKRFAYSKELNVNELFRNCFGIECPNEEKLEDIILSFEPVQGKYILSLPLHESQRIIIDTADELQISLRLYLTHDLLMELLSYGSTLKVIAPQKLKDEVCKQYSEALEKNLLKKTYFLLEEGREHNSFLKDNDDFGTMEHGVE
jgi:predicted DNA-binding transcriptional regulator YafY